MMLSVMKFKIKKKNLNPSFVLHYSYLGWLRNCVPLCEESWRDVAGEEGEPEFTGNPWAMSD